MEIDALKAIVGREIEPLMRRIGIPHWRVDVRYQQIDEDGCRAVIDLAPEYERAAITMDAYKLPDAAAARETLTHELLHVVAAPMVLVEAFVNRRLGDESHKGFREVNRHAVESTVRNLERLWHGSGAKADHAREIDGADTP